MFKVKVFKLKNSSVFIVNFEPISNLFLVFLWLIMNNLMLFGNSSVSSFEC